MLVCKASFRDYPLRGRWMTAYYDLSAIVIEPEEMVQWLLDKS